LIFSNNIIRDKPSIRYKYFFARLNNSVRNDKNFACVIEPNACIVAKALIAGNAG
jgi:hypothetical protein